MDAPNQFTATSAHQLLELLKRRQVLPEAEAEAAVYALAEIAQSMERVYSELIPSILSDPGAGTDALKDHVWDIREEFRHVAYHIQDGKLTDL